MKIYGQFSDPTNGPLIGLKHELEYKHALDTIRLKNYDLYGGRFFLKTIFFGNVNISFPKSLNLFDDDNILEKIFWLYLKICAKIFNTIAHNRIQLGLGS
ncbi:MAG: hypothetical protein CM15mP54_00120 [Paracoccaceae bacterium]|nr:MAG: hypothetical protein CM15mP54_00120 [Paracoccaceae bacterium]